MPAELPRLPHLHRPVAMPQMPRVCAPGPGTCVALCRLLSSSECNHIFPEYMFGYIRLRRRGRTINSDYLKKSEIRGRKKSHFHLLRCLSFQNLSLPAPTLQRDAYFFVCMCSCKMHMMFHGLYACIFNLLIWDCVTVLVLLRTIF